MSQFLTDLQHYTFLQNALLTGILASVACGIIGTYVVVRRISYIADGIAHTVLGGMGAALYFHKVYHWQGVMPIHGALVSAIIAAIIIGDGNDPGEDEQTHAQFTLLNILRKRQLAILKLIGQFPQSRRILCLAS